MADSLFLGWLNAYNIGFSKSVIPYQLLILDDDDGILSNGTPNLSEIDSGFLANGWPGFISPPIRRICQ